MKQTPYDVVLAVAGSDSGGCAGIQADIKSISANGAFASTVITAITAQNTMGVQHIFSIPTEHIVHQIHSVMCDIDVKAIKIGMLHSAQVVEAVQKALGEYSYIPIVLDPVMVSASGDRLIDDEAVHALKAFLPHAALITPNIPEAQVLLDGERITEKNLHMAAEQLGEKYATSVLLKGGHLQTKHALQDVLYLHKQARSAVFTSDYVDTQNTHGTGCTLSAAIAAHMAQSKPIEQASAAAHAYVAAAISAGAHMKLGRGCGPVHHFYSTEVSKQGRG